jgi:hypothetical protein
MPTTSPMTRMLGAAGSPLGSRTDWTCRHSRWTGLSFTRGARTRREGALVTPASSNSSTPCGAGAALRFIASRRSQVARLTTNSPVASTLATESLKPPSVAWLPVAEKITCGGV